MADPAAVAAVGGAGADQGLEAHLLPANNQQDQRMFPMNRTAFIGFLSKVADAAVMGLLTLNIFSATFLLAWGKEGSVCLPKPKDDPKKLQGDNDFSLPSWVKVIIVGIPFTMYPFTVYVSGLVKAAEQGRHTLGLVATLCLMEFVYGLLIGGVMTFCMSNASWKSVLVVTVLLNALLLVIWGRYFEYPACLRRFMSCACIQQAAPAPEGIQNNNPQAPLVPPANNENEEKAQAALDNPQAPLPPPGNHQDGENPLDVV